MCAFLRRVGFSVGDPSAMVKSGIQNIGEEVTFRRGRGFSPEVGSLCRQLLSSCPKVTFPYFSQKMFHTFSSPLRCPSPPTLSPHTWLGFSLHGREWRPWTQLTPSCFHSHLLPLGFEGWGSRHSVSSLSQHWYPCLYHCLHSRSPNSFSDKMGWVNSLINLE